MMKRNMGSRRSPRRWPVAAALLAATALLTGPAVAGDYLLGPQDKLRLKVFEWRASRDEVFAWEALNDEYVVAADGTVSMPLLGGIRAAGLSPPEFAKTVSEQLAAEMQLGRLLDVAVEVVQFRPFYIVGQVAQPGEFPYRPGLTVLQALSIAGGLRTREEGLVRTDREIIAGRGEITLLSLSQTSLLIKKARLQAELGEAKAFQLPKELDAMSSDRTVAVLFAQEQLIFEARRENVATQVRALDDLRNFLDKEVTSLERQLELYDTQLELVEKELSGVSTLVGKGLAAAPREMSLSRLLAEIQGERLSTETAFYRANQEISRTEVSLLTLKNSHRNEVTTQLREVQVQLDELGAKADTALQLLHDSEDSGPRLLAMRNAAARAEPRFTIVRPDASGGVKEIAASENTEIQPGDTVKVVVPLPTFGPFGEDPEETEPRAGATTDGAAG
jgi:protein involved in polysaccharide export with SLBB domain